MPARGDVPGYRRGRRLIRLSSGVVDGIFFEPMSVTGIADVFPCSARNTSPEAAALPGECGTEPDRAAEKAQRDRFSGPPLIFGTGA